MKKLFGRTHALLALAIVLAPTLIYGQTTAAPSPTPSLRTGTLDARFGGGGTLTTDFVAGSGNEALSVVVQPDGMIVAAGQAVITGALDFVLARYE